MKKTYLRGLATKAANGRFRVLASTAAIDRQGDIVRQDGWELENFKKNPVILWAHDYDELPIGKATELNVSVEGLEIEFEFAPAEGNPKAAQVQKLMEEGYLNAVSVGFIPKERNGNVIIRSELLELSVVPVPANQEALRLAMAKGIDFSDIAKELEAGEQVPADVEKPVVPAAPVEEPVAEKVGRTLSSANRSKITKARDALTDAVAALDELLLADADKSSHEDNGNDPEKGSVDKDLLKILQSQLRGSDRVTESALSVVGKLLRSKGALTD